MITDKQPRARKSLKKRKTTRKATPIKPKMETKTMENPTEIEVKEPEARIVPPPTQSEVDALPEVVIPPNVSVKSAARRERVPLGAPRLKLSAPERPGYKRRWINDVGGRPEQAEAGGYEFVTDTGLQIGETAVGSGNQDLGSRVSRIVGTLPNGQPKRAYLMEIREEFYENDQKEKQQRLDKIDDQIRGGTFNPDNDNDTKRYVPTAGISLK
jgi:hypothetical protein